MKDEHCVRFLQWALPQLRMRWPGFRKVRGQVCKRIARRIGELGLDGVASYRAWLGEHAGEWAHLDSLCRITISRFYRDRAVFDTLAQQVLPALAGAAHRRGEEVLRIWSAGCGSGEEPYTLALVWQLGLRPRISGMAIDIVATDIDPHLLRRARDGDYASGSLRELPGGWRDIAFARTHDSYRLEPAYRKDVRFVQQDIRQERPDGRFDLVLCRNLAFTYFDRDRQAGILKRILDAMHHGGALVLGAHERPPDPAQGISAWYGKRAIYQKLGSGAGDSVKSLT